MGKLIDLTGKQFNKLIVIKKDESGSFNRVAWVCKCDCGNITSIIGKDIKSGHSKSCGCNKIKAAINAGKSNITHGMTKTPEYNVWIHIIQRCYNTNNSNYHNYGGRGIIVCDRWKNSFEIFYKDMGPRLSDKHSLDRINNNGNYEPSNCRWTTMTEQNRNRNFNVIKNIQEANDIRELYKNNNYTQQELADSYNCSVRIINQIILNKIWIMI